MGVMEDALQHVQWLRQVRAEGPWYRFETVVAAETKKRSAQLWILDVIDPWYEDPAALVRQIARLEADDITVHLNSPGGDAFGAVAIYNALRDHSAPVLTVVEGLAASAASLVAMAGDTVRMNRGATMMIHDPSAFAYGPPDIMEKAREMLDTIADEYAEIYAAKAGGDAETWRGLMRAETWFTSQEAVDFGLADERVADEPAAAASASFDLSRFAFAYAGRQAAPAPRKPAPGAPPSSAITNQPAPAGGNNIRKGAGGMDPAMLREALGLAADASDDEVRAALASAGVTSAAGPPAGGSTGSGGEPVVGPETVEPVEGTVLLDAEQYQTLRAQAMRGDEAFRMLREAECEQVLDAAIRDGKIPAGRRDHYQALWAADPDGTKAMLGRLAKNVIPVSEVGMPGVGEETEIDMLYRQMYPEEANSRG